MSEVQGQSERIIYWKPADTRPIERTNVIHRYRISRVYSVEVHPQDAGNFLIDIELAKGCELSFTFSEIFDVQQLCEAVENYEIPDISNPK